MHNLRLVCALAVLLILFVAVACSQPTPAATSVPVPTMTSPPAPAPTATPVPTPTTTPTATLAPAPTSTPVPPIPTANQQARASIDGDWEGATIYRLRDLVTIVHFESREEKIQGTLDFPQIGRIGLPLSKVSFEHPKVHFELSEFSTVFDGELNGDTISGEFVDPDGSGPFNLKRISP